MEGYVKRINDPNQFHHDKVKHPPDLERNAIYLRKAKDYSEYDFYVHTWERRADNKLVFKDVQDPNKSGFDVYADAEPGSYILMCRLDTINGEPVQ